MPNSQTPQQKRRFNFDSGMQASDVVQNVIQHIPICGDSIPPYGEHHFVCSATLFSNLIL